MDVPPALLPLVAILLVATSALPAPSAGSPSAEAVTLLPSLLPSARSHTSAVFDGSAAYVFGGLSASGQPLDEIVRFVPATGEVTVMGARLPSPRWATAAAWDGTYAYVMGGYGATREIARYDPASDNVQVMPTLLPYHVYLAASVWGGDAAYLFGSDADDFLERGRNVLRYDPAAGTAQVVAQLPSAPFERRAAVWDGSRAIVLGGLDEFNQERIELALFDPATGDARPAAAFLPTPHASMSAVWDGSHVLAFGGGFYVGEEDSRIMRYDPVEDRAVHMRARLPHPTTATSAVWDGTHAYVFGGAFAAGRDIARYDPSLDAANGRPSAAFSVSPTTVACEGGRGTFSLDASASTDPDADPLAFSWTGSSGGIIQPRDAPLAQARFGPGAHFVSLTVRDAWDDDWAPSIRVEVTDAAPPSVAISRPLPGRVYLFDEEQPDPHPAGGTLAVGPITIRAEAADACAVVSVTFRTPLGPLFVDTMPPYEFRYNPGPPHAAPVVLEAVALDAGGHESVSTLVFEHVATRVANLGGIPVLSQPIHDRCREAGVEPVCEGLIGPPPEPYH